ncbi:MULTISPECIES: hypothetical protein [unclassified Leptolyngbya]|nr:MULTISPECIES: hypothetical protein [unclassified Leptolyngbya]
MGQSPTPLSRTFTWGDRPNPHLTREEPAQLLCTAKLHCCLKKS